MKEETEESNVAANGDIEMTRVLAAVEEEEEEAKEEEIAAEDGERVTKKNDTLSTEADAKTEPSSQLVPQHEGDRCKTRTHTRTHRLQHTQRTCVRYAALSMPPIGLL